MSFLLPICDGMLKSFVNYGIRRDPCRVRIRTYRSTTVCLYTCPSFLNNHIHFVILRTGCMESYLNAFSFNRIVIIFQVKSAAKVNLSDKVLASRSIPVMLLTFCYMVIWTFFGQPHIENMTTDTGFMYVTCLPNVWDYVAESSKCYCVIMNMLCNDRLCNKNKLYNSSILYKVNLIEHPR